MIPKVYPPESRTMITLEVRRREFLTPGFASITLGGPAVRNLVVAGNDQAVRLFFPGRDRPPCGCRPCRTRPGSPS